MATEEPQALPVVQKSADSAPSEEKVNDDPSIQSVNGHSEDKSKADEKPSVNGKAEPTESVADDSVNQKAFAANGALPEQSTEVPPSLADVEMADVNGTSDVEKAPSPTAEVAKEDNAELTSDKPDVTEESVANEPAVVNTGDSMDVDTPVEQAGEEPKAKPENSSQEKTEEKPKNNDTTEPVSSQELSQPSAGLAKLDIKAAQSDAPATQVDTPMTDQPTSAAKVSRERDEDGAEERAAKRAKTEEDANESTAKSLVVAGSVPSAPAPAPTESVDQVPDDQPITSFQGRQIRQILAGVKKTKNGLNFRQSVEKLWPALWEDYKAKIENPVDISYFEQKLREEKYANYGELKADLQLLYQNSLAFNGDTNVITVAAGAVRDLVYARLPEISKLEEPAKPEKGKAHPTRHTEPRAATQPRRQSQSQPRGQAASPKPRRPSPTQTPLSATSTSAPAFAIPPNGIPQIRRDSTREDNDRPKRPIHPPKNRDLDYAAANRKKLEPEQRFFEMALEEVKKGKHYALNQWFLTPVDPVALNIPTYFSIVKKPMDLATMTQKNYEGEYKTVKDIEKDMRLIVHNAELFNGANHDVTLLAKRLEELFKTELGKRDAWMKRHNPPEPPSTTNASAPSPERSTHESEEESEADDNNDEGNEAFRTLQTRLDEEQAKLNKELGSKKPDLTMIEIQQQMVSMLQRKLVEERTKLHTEKKPKSKKKATKSKPKSGGGGSAATSKKAAAGNSAASKKASGSSGHKKASPKGRPVGALEKAVIAEGINELDGNTLTRAVEIIKRDTGQNENDEGEMELDIDALSIDALRKLYELIHKTNPHVRAGIERRPEFSRASEPESKPKSAAPTKPKKNKPMNKHEQERKIEQLRELKAQLQRGGSGSQEPLPNEVEESRRAESSEEETDSEEE
ncbi:Bromodomain-containing protein [Rostrohypoxylon terebratum]|nr:Bromodomain-containing protein [Rostrohypoxylon terebratum]